VEGLLSEGLGMISTFAVWDIAVPACYPPLLWNSNAIPKTLLDASPALLQPLIDSLNLFLKAFSGCRQFGRFIRILGTRIFDSLPKLDSRLEQFLHGRFRFPDLIDGPLHSRDSLLTKMISRGPSQRAAHVCFPQTAKLVVCTGFSNPLAIALGPSLRPHGS
jgi:hypothetical protein